MYVLYVSTTAVRRAISECKHTVIPFGVLSSNWRVVNDVVRIEGDNYESGSGPFIIIRT